MNQSRVGGCAVVIQGKLVVIGGRGADGKPLASMEVYNETTDSWRFGPDMTVPRQDAACAELDGLIYMIGGFDGKESLDTVEVFDPSSGQWSRVADLCDRRHGATAAVVDSALYVAGGMDCVVGTANADVSMQTLASAEVFIPKHRCWQQIKPMQVARREAGGCHVPRSVVDPRM